MTPTKSSVSSNFQILVLLIAALSVSGILVCSASDSSDAAGNNLSGVTALVFTQADEDYSDLIYLNDKLPLTLSPSEWKRSSEDGFWYNVNSNSSDYGAILLYGMVSGIANDVIRQDVLDAYSAVFTGTDFQIVQVRYTVSDSCSFTVSIAKAGMTTFSSTSDAPSSFDGYVFTGKHQSGKIYTVDNSAGDVKPAVVRGSYNVSMVSDGVDCLSKGVTILGAPIDLGGTVTDADGNPIGSVAVNYTDGSGAKRVYTDSSGIYHIYADYGSEVDVTSLTVNGYTFAKTSYSYGTALEDVSPSSVVFKASEHAVNVTVLDQSSRGVSGLGVTAVWYYQRDLAGKTEVSTEAPVGTTEGSATALDSTDSSGLTKVVFSTPVLGDGVTAKLVIAVYTEGTRFTAQVATIATGTDVTPLPSSLTGEGNAYADTDSLSDVSLKVEQSSIITKVLDAGSANGISKASLDAVWYYQEYDGVDSRYIISAAASSRSWVTTAGTAWADDSSEGGEAVVHYTLPVGTFTSTQKAYLFVAVNSVGGICSYTFDLPYITSGQSTFEELCSGHAGCSYAAVDAVADLKVNVNEAAYLITYKVTGSDIPEQVTATIAVGTSQETVEAQRVGSDLKFSFVLTDGTVATVTLVSEGYTMDPAVRTFTASSDATMTSVSTINATEFQRGTPVSVGSPVKISGLADGDVVTVDYTLDGSSYRVCLVASSSEITYQPVGWGGSSVRDVDVIDQAGELYIENTSGYSYIVAHTVTYSFVTFCSSDGVPTLSNVSKNIAITAYVNGISYQTFRTDASGIGTITVPSVSDLRFMYESYSVSGKQITSGPFAGYSAFNLDGITNVDTTKYVTITIKYTASNSIDGSTKEIVNSDSSLYPVTAVIKVGSNETFNAPALNGFGFSGWYFMGENITGSSDGYACTITATASMDGQVLIASYSTHLDEAEKETDMTAIAVGMVAIVIAILAFAFIFMQTKRY